MHKMAGGLMLLMIDHLSGEEMGHLMGRLYFWGAGNVHVVPTQTKKSRPGYLVFADISRVEDALLSENLAREFGISGYHRIESSHCHREISSTTSTLTVCHRGESISIDFPVKVIGSCDSPLHARAEYEGLALICDTIHARCGAAPSLSLIKKEIAKKIRTGGLPRIIIE
ncbi:MAG: DUF111 family protein [Spirochaetes bacterium]|nr:DUF111 family protein [Spirochaetota bacterium]